MPTAGGSFQVTPAELNSLAAGIGAIKLELDSTPDLVGDCASALGCDVVAEALAMFVSGWRDGRKQISTEIGALGDMLTQASSAYSSTEHEICVAIPVGTS